jgi:hypothetical protein
LGRSTSRSGREWLPIAGVRRARTGRRRAELPPQSQERPALSQTEAEQAMDRLIEMSFLKFVAEPQKDQVRAQLVER